MIFQGHGLVACTTAKSVNRVQAKKAARSTAKLSNANSSYSIVHADIIL